MEDTERESVGVWEYGSSGVECGRLRPLFRAASRGWDNKATSSRRTPKWRLLKASTEEEAAGGADSIQVLLAQLADEESDDGEEIG